jgi:hypothetical protein
MKCIMRKLLFLPLFLLVSLIGFDCIPSFDIFPIENAEARVGRPATPRSGAGVARRTTRRTVRRHRIAVGTRVTVLPAGCTTVITRNVTYHHCGGVHYRPYY